MEVALIPLKGSDGPCRRTGGQEGQEEFLVFLEEDFS
jgi:hypothetical protein